MSSTDPQNTDMGGRSMLQSLANSNTKKSTDNKVYVYPLVKRSSSKLDEKSLQCALKVYAMKLILKLAIPSYGFSYA
ncbi:hypothetical protein COLO4_35348 [Corchorus olitorius]|uniref:Uncharacterized protein n=1 Tax=Corchorus olitorius TaxID=93759 RepID=A0A1R3GHF5_9ROSI|nr:hypothetical protein COLO4_35348 [Corchorus olitorius]